MAMKKVIRYEPAIITDTELINEALGGIASMESKLKDATTKAEIETAKTLKNYGRKIKDFKVAKTFESDFSFIPHVIEATSAITVESVNETMEVLTERNESILIDGSVNVKEKKRETMVTTAKGLDFFRAIYSGTIKGTIRNKNGEKIPAKYAKIVADWVLHGRTDGKIKRSDFTAKKVKTTSPVNS